jgi:hypothetical protein
MNRSAAFSKPNRRNKIAATRVPVVTILGVVDGAAWFVYRMILQWLLALAKLHVDRSSWKGRGLSQSSLLARACLGPTRNDGSHVSDSRDA